MYDVEVCCRAKRKDWGMALTKRAWRGDDPLSITLFSIKLLMHVKTEQSDNVKI